MNFNLNHNIIGKSTSCCFAVIFIIFFVFIELGGTNWTVQLGKRDSTTASLSAAISNIPAPTLNLSGLLSAFSNKGFTANDLVALLGWFNFLNP